MQQLIVFILRFSNFRLAEELERRGWRPSELDSRRKNDPEKLELAARLWRETTLSMKAIAARVYLGISKSANAHLHHHMVERGMGGIQHSPAMGK